MLPSAGEQAAGADKEHDFQINSQAIISRNLEMRQMRPKGPGGSGAPLGVKAKPGAPQAEERDPLRLQRCNYQAGLALRHSALLQDRVERHAPPGPGWARDRDLDDETTLH